MAGRRPFPGRADAFNAPFGASVEAALPRPARTREYALRRPVITSLDVLGQPRQLAIRQPGLNEMYSQRYLSITIETLIQFPRNPNSSSITSISGLPFRHLQYISILTGLKFGTCTTSTTR